MKPEEQRIAIAKACGYGKSSRLEDGPMIALYNPPDYLNDLNAAIQLCDFLVDRGFVVTIDNGLDKTWECTFIDEDDRYYYPANTLAEAICGAFLRALNLWVEETT